MCHIYLTFITDIIYLRCQIYMTHEAEFMNRVKEYRTELKISQIKLASEIGVARQTINMIENDKYNPSLDLCIKLAKALGTDLNQLFWEE